MVNHYDLFFLALFCFDSFETDLAWSVGSTAANLENWSGAANGYQDFSGFWLGVVWELTLFFGRFLRQLETFAFRYVSPTIREN